MNSSIKSYRFSLLAISFFSLSLSKTSASESPLSSISAKHIESGGVGYDTGYTTLEGFLMTSTAGDIYPFIDLRGHLFDDGKWAANTGIGVRGFIGDRLYGINTYYDFRQASHLSANQLAIGLETLGDFIDFRINGYLPFGKKISSAYHTQFYQFSGHYAQLKQKRTFAMKGVDAELGFRFGDCSSWNFYAALGPYYFNGPYSTHAIGGKTRFNVGYKDYIRLEVIESYDNLFHNHVQGSIALSYPIGKKPTQNSSIKQHCQLKDPVSRNEIIVMDKKNLYPKAINPLTHEPYYFVFVDNTSSSLGTYENPYHSLIQAEENSLANQILYIFPGDGTTNFMDEGITLKPSQKLWGSSISHQLQTTQGFVRIPNFSSDAPKITNLLPDGIGVTLSTNNTISGITLIETDSQAILGYDPESLEITYCQFQECGLSGGGKTPVFIHTSVPFNGTIDNNIFMDNVNGGVYIILDDIASSNTISFNSNFATNNGSTTGGSAILNIDPNGTVDSLILNMHRNLFTYNNNLNGVTTANFYGSQLGNLLNFDGRFTENTFTNMGRGITHATNGNIAKLLIKNNDLSNNKSGSIYILSGSDKISEIHLTIDSNNMSGTVNDNNETVYFGAPADHYVFSITNNTISDNSSSGLLFFVPTAPFPQMDLVIENNIITNNRNTGSQSGGGISIDGFDGLNVKISNNTLSNNVEGNAIGVSGTSLPKPTLDAFVVFENNTLLEGDYLDFRFYGETPSQACLNIQGNTSTTASSYRFSQQASGSCFLSPCSYETVNVGDFTLSGVTPSSDCSGTICD